MLSSFFVNQLFIIQRERAAGCPVGAFRRGPQAGASPGGDAVRPQDRRPGFGPPERNARLRRTAGTGPAVGLAGSPFPLRVFWDTAAGQRHLVNWASHSEWVYFREWDKVER